MNELRKCHLQTMPPCSPRRCTLDSRGARFLPHAQQMTFPAVTVTANYNTNAIAGVGRVGVLIWEGYAEEFIRETTFTHRCRSQIHPLVQPLPIIE